MKIRKDKIVTGWSPQSDFLAKERAGYRLAIFDNGKDGFHLQWVRQSKVES